MSEKLKSKLQDFVSVAAMQEIVQAIKKYPEDQRQSAVMNTLRIVQEQHGYLTSELMELVADFLKMPPIAVYEVASFYSMYTQQPRSQHVLSVCQSISCHLKGSQKILQHLERKLETEPDQKFSLQAVECLGACVHAPVIQIDKDYYENLSEQKIDEILEQF